MKLTLAYTDEASLSDPTRRAFEGGDFRELLYRALAELESRQRVVWLHVDREE